VSGRPAASQLAVKAPARVIGEPIQDDISVVDKPPEGGATARGRPGAYRK